jgi:hypothetical protein
MLLVMQQSQGSYTEMTSVTEDSGMLGDPRSVQEGRIPSQSTSVPPPASGERRWTFQITDDIDGYIVFPEDISIEEVNAALSDYLAYMERRRRRKGGQSSNETEVTTDD